LPGIYGGLQPIGRLDIYIAPAKNGLIIGLVGCPPVSVGFRTFPESGMSPTHFWDLGMAERFAELKRRHIYRVAAAYPVMETLP
jgi:hypothetical protein